jgi:DNA (cytosine-5)-methyltransferase 1
LDNPISNGWGQGRNGNHPWNDGKQPDANGGYDWPGPTNGFWRTADWLHCRDERWRAVEPGSFPLAHGVAGRMGRLRAYGNAITAPVATAFIEVAQECLP